MTYFAERSVFKDIRKVDSGPVEVGSAHTSEINFVKKYKSLAIEFIQWNSV